MGHLTARQIYGPISETGAPGRPSKSLAMGGLANKLLNYLVSGSESPMLGFTLGIQMGHSMTTLAVHCPAAKYLLSALSATLLFP